jgi:trans-aconitate 2-methyltransferase
MANVWDPERYLQFRAERRRPYEDLVALVRPDSRMRIVDLGCGPGELTADLAERFDAAAVIGIDSDAAMLSRAQVFASSRVAFEQADIATHPLHDFDLVFSNAALHWLPDHEALFGRLRAALRGGGQLAVQMPDNFGQPTHTIAVDVASEPPFIAALGGKRSGAAVETPERYATLLHALGFREQIVREQVYLHELPGPEQAIDWVRGSMLSWYAGRLSPELYAEFERRYAERLLAALGSAQPFPLTYRRLLLWATL